MDKQLKSNLTSKRSWTRLIYMIVFAICLQVSSVVMWVLVALQFLFTLITGRDNLNLRRLGDSLSQYIYQALQFLTYASDDKPFPFSEWPVSDIVENFQEDVDSSESSQVESGEIIDHETDANSESQVDDSGSSSDENVTPLANDTSPHEDLENEKKDP